jgi:hypothetical protein
MLWRFGAMCTYSGLMTGYEDWNCHTRVYRTKIYSSLRISALSNLSHAHWCCPRIHIHGISISGHFARYSSSRRRSSIPSTVEYLCLESITINSCRHVRRHQRFGGLEKSLGEGSLQMYCRTSTMFGKSGIHEVGT